ncbi:MAG: helix-turn-helix transcriptional regulator [Armatimonadota bacterium]
MSTQNDTLLPDLKYQDCPCAGRNLDKLVQPAILAVLASEEAHGYILVQRLMEMPMFRGQKPDATGVYRYLRQMEERELVTSKWDTSKAGPAKRVYGLTEEGRSCLAHWIDTLSAYHDALGELLEVTRTAITEENT